MDVLLRLRVLIWVLVLTLWGMLVYQFLGEEDKEQAQMQPIVNPFRGVPRAEPAPGERSVLPPDADERSAAASKILPPGPPPAIAALSGPPMLPAVLPEAPPPVESLEAVRTPDFLKPRVPTADPARRAQTKGGTRREAALKQHDLPIPPGFVKRSTRHFTVYAEGDPASDEFLELLENLHGNLMLDLAAFSPWAQEQKVSLFLFKNQDTYRRVTGRPAWSGGASSVPKHKVYIYESEELPGILAHELCHIYYDGFFLEGKSNPLWLSEGMATLIQVERGMAAPNWLRENLELLERGGGYSMSELMSINSTSGAADERVRLWYAQSYSVVRFLIRSQYKSSFYNFSRFLREGRPVTESLYRGYGMPYNRLKALEYAWRYEITTNGISKNNSSAPAE